MRQNGHICPIVCDVLPALHDPQPGRVHQNDLFQWNLAVQLSPVLEEMAAKQGKRAHQSGHLT